MRWHIRLTSGEVTDQEQREFEDWVTANPAHRQAYVGIQKLWQETGQLTYDRHTRHIMVSERPQAKRRRPKRRKRSQRGWTGSAVAGTALLAACLTVIWWNGWHRQIVSDYATDEERQTVHLSADVQMTLDAQTTVDIERQQGHTFVTLQSGAAWFTVRTKPEEHAVHVLTDQVTVTSLGTEFLVEHTSNHQFVAVTEHAVTVASRSAVQHTNRLDEGYGLTIEDRSPESWTKTPIDPATIGTWRHGRLIFENVPLQKVVERLDDYHPGMLLITDNSLLYQKVSGVFDIEHPDRALASLQLAFPVTLRRLSSYVVLISKT
ncbi:MAG: inner membrane sensor for iron transport [Nitrospirales bacterium]|nr:MAG: inner membrane sensor for iron transport [Nitrospirales bacterium]